MSNGDISRVDATDIQNSFKHYKAHQHPKIAAESNADKILRETASEKGLSQAI